MSELKSKIIEANNEALTRHFLKLLYQLEERVEALEVKLSKRLGEVEKGGVLNE